MTLRTLILAGAALSIACAPVRRLLGIRGVTLPVREGFVTADDGVQLFYRVVGRGRDTVIAIDGGPGLPMGSLVNFEALAAGGTVIFYDQRGGGHSSLPRDSTQVTLRHHIADLDAVRRHFRIDRAALLGHSWGGFLAASYSIEYPARVSRLVLVAPTPPRVEPYIREHFARMASSPVMQLAAQWDTTSAPSDLCARMARAFGDMAGETPQVRDSLAVAVCTGVPETAIRAGWTTTPRWTMASIGPWDLRSRVREVQAPVLVIHGGRDMFPEAAMREWATSFPRARLVIMPNAGHSPFASDPSGFAALVRDFLARE